MKSSNTNKTFKQRTIYKSITENIQTQAVQQTQPNENMENKQKQHNMETNKTNQQTKPNI